MWTLPLTFVAGVHGFALFAPYLLVVATLSVSLTIRRRAPAAVAVEV
jgi:hypothetical protein